MLDSSLVFYTVVQDSQGFQRMALIGLLLFPFLFVHRETGESVVVHRQDTSGAAAIILQL